MNTNENIWLFMGCIAAIVLVGFIMHPALGVLLLLGSIPLTLHLKANNWSITTTKNSPIDPNKDSESQDNKSSVAETNEPQNNAPQDNKPSVAETNEPQNNAPQDSRSFTRGIVLILFINFLVFCFGSILLVFLSPNKSNFILMFFSIIFSVMIGLGQLLYIIPWVISLKKSGKSMLIKGIITGAIITTLINGGFFLILTRNSILSMIIFVIILVVLPIALLILMYRKTKQNNNTKTNLISDDKKNSEKMTEFAGGILLAGITNILAYILGILILGIFIMITGVGAIFIFLMFFIPIGLVQLLYIIPLVLKLRKSGNKSMSNGVIAGAILTAIFNALIYLYFSVYGL